MSDLRDAARQALEALKLAIGVLSDEDETESNAVRASIKALKAALEQPDQAEPVDAEAALRFALAQRDWAFKQLQAQPDRREWRGLTEEEIAKCWHDTPGQQGGWNLAFTRAIEAALRSKNHE